MGSVRPTRQMSSELDSFPCSLRSSHRRRSSTPGSGSRRGSSGSVFLGPRNPIFGRVSLAGEGYRRVALPVICWPVDRGRGLSNDVAR